MLERNQLYLIDFKEGFSNLDDESVDSIVTSPPYWLARKYGLDGGFGQENSPQKYIENYDILFTQSMRVLKPHGGLWLVIGDCRSQGKRRQLGRRDTDERGGENFKGWSDWDGDTTIVKVEHDIPPKSFMLIPEQIALLALQHEFILRDKIVWAKGAMYWDETTRGGTTPSPIEDRFTTSWEHVYYFTKDRYSYFNKFAIQVPKVSENGWKIPPNVWVIPPQVGKEESYPKGWKNYATYPVPLSDICVKAGTPSLTCGDCGKPLLMRPEYSTYKKCTCNVTKNNIQRIPTKGGLVLDPFIGSGTTAISCIKYGYEFIGFDISDEQLEYAQLRIDSFVDTRGERMRRRYGYFE
ncbi:MAG: DNA-methyltransferase [Candidatus Kariarchaeaceae archaeon]|jgi:hypothetical protein